MVRRLFSYLALTRHQWPASVLVFIFFVDGVDGQSILLGFPFVGGQRILLGFPFVDGQCPLLDFLLPHAMPSLRLPSLSLSSNPIAQ